MTKQVEYDSVLTQLMRRGKPHFISRQFLFEPQADITAYELALMLPLLIDPLDTGVIARWPPEVRRHLKELNSTSGLSDPADQP